MTRDSSPRLRNRDSEHIGLLPILSGKGTQSLEDRVAHSLDYAKVKIYLHMSAYYEDSDYAPTQDKLEPVKAKLDPSPSPPPYSHHYIITTGSRTNNDRPADGRKRPRRKHQASQGDVVLLNYMAPNAPEVAREAGQRPLCSASQSETSDSEDDEMSDGEGQSSPTVNQGPNASNTQTNELMTKAQEAMKVHSIVQGGMNSIGPGMASQNLDRARSGFAPHQLDTRIWTDHNSPTSFPMTSARLPPGTPREPDGEEVREVQAINGLMQLNHPKTESPTLSDDGYKISPIVNPHMITPSVPSPAQTLPALDQVRSTSLPGSATSLQSDYQLPSIRDVVDHVAIEADTSRARGSSFSSAPTLSPSMKAKQAFSGPGSPGSPSHRYPRLTHTSPITSDNSRSPINMFDGISPGSSNSPVNSRLPGRRRATSDATSQYPNPIRLASNGTRAGQSTSIDGHDRTSILTANDARLSLDGNNSAILSKPSTSQSDPSASQPPGLYHCTYEGCSAAPFQTQYLLNSHANVHSETRPHYCPVKGCSRGEGGRGFKRKNEMIRHGLVHDSPGYVCPYCPDREHKYPRPDNLQRHVRMHHDNVFRDDPRLQDVLSQRPPGSTNRGRRRPRGSS